MRSKHPLIPRVRMGSGLTLTPSDKARICMDCDQSDKKCSYRCKRYTRELEKLEQNNDGNSNGKSN